MIPWAFYTNLFWRFYDRFLEKQVERDDPKDGVDETSKTIEPLAGPVTEPLDMGGEFDIFDPKVFVDFRDTAPKSKRKKYRPVTKVTGVVLHQSAVQRTPEAAMRRAHLVTGHIYILPDGRWTWNHPFDAYLYAADLFNRFTISIEFSGNFEGHPGKGDWYKPERFGKGRPTAVQIRRGRQILRWLTKELPNLKMVLAHRQARTPPKAAKVLDPGWEIYYHVAMWAEQALGLERRPKWTLGNGKEIPPEWENPPQELIA